MKKKNILFSFLSIGTLTLLTGCDNEKIAERIETTVNNMLPNLYVTLMQLLLFIVTVVIFILLAYKPLKKKLKQRQDFINKNIEDSIDKNKKADENIKRSQEVILESQKKAVDIIQDAQMTAEYNLSRAQKELQVTIENQKNQAHKDIEAEREKMLKEAQNQIIESAIDTSKEILKREVKLEDHKKFVDDFIKELDK